MTYIFDIDGTLADCSHRLHFITGRKKNWDKFYQAMSDDKPIWNTVQLMKKLDESGDNIIFITGRPINYNAQTQHWLNQFKLSHYKLYMRTNSDKRADTIIKKEIYDNFIKNTTTIDGVFEDRKQCVDMWRSLGLTCYQVAEGDY